MKEWIAITVRINPSLGNSPGEQLFTGGERQRISIARALLKDAPIVLLDEATSSVDILNETELQQAISRLTKDKTVIVIAHRMRTIVGADKIILLKDGKVASEGTHAEIMKKSIDYKNMVNLQNESMNWSLKSSVGNSYSKNSPREQ